jgi:hypothetical protein
MTYENTYRDDIAHGIIQTVFLFFFTYYLFPILVTMLLCFRRKYQKQWIYLLNHTFRNAKNLLHL